MKVIQVKNNESMSIKAVEMFSNVMKKVENPVLGLATGSTPKRMYEILIDHYLNGKLTFEKAITFNLDEYVGLGAEHKGSYHYYMDNYFFNKIDIKKENTHIPNGLASCLLTECNRYEKLISNAGKLDFLVLGIGENGHIGFNEPGTPFDSRTHVVELTQSTREVNARFFERIEDVPHKALTMGLASIMEAKKIILLVQGDQKKLILKEVINGQIKENIPGSILQRHPNVTVITDIDV